MSGGLLRIFPWWRKDSPAERPTRMLEPTADRAVVAVALQEPSLNPAQVYVMSLAPGSRRTMRQALKTVATLVTSSEIVDPYQFPWHALRFAHTAAIRAQLGELYAPATANKILSALRGTLKVAWQQRVMDADDYQRAISIKPIGGETIPAGRAITADELDALLATCQDATTLGTRDAAIIALLYSGGLRRAECEALDLAHYAPGAQSLRIHGKRNKQRIAYLNTDAVAVLADWLALRGATRGPLFPCCSPEGLIIVGSRLSDSGIYKMLQRRAREADIAHLSPHDFRRTFVGDLLDAQVDIATVKAMAGHASIETTARYDRRPEERKQRAAGLLRLRKRGE